MQFKRVVAEGYDAIADKLEAEPYPSPHVQEWLEKFAGLVPASSRILELGCGSGYPYTQFLAERFRVVGIDISRRQLELAKRRLPDCEFVQADMASLALPDNCFSGVVAIYSIIHVPRDEQPGLLQRIGGWLEPDGCALLVLGASDLPLGSEDDWFGAPMLWSHFDAESSLAMLAEAGLRVLESGVEADGLDPQAGHLFALCANRG